MDDNERALRSSPPKYYVVFKGPWCLWNEDESDRLGWGKRHADRSGRGVGLYGKFNRHKFVDKYIRALGEGASLPNSVDWRSHGGREAGSIRQPWKARWKSYGTSAAALHDIQGFCALYDVTIPTKIKTYDTLAREAKEADHARGRFVGDGLEEHHMGARPYHATKNSVKGLRRHNEAQKQEFLLETATKASTRYRGNHRQDSAMSDASWMSEASFMSDSSTESVGRVWPLRENAGASSGGSCMGREQRWLAKKNERQQFVQDGWQTELEEEAERRRAQVKQEELDLEAYRQRVKEEVADDSDAGRHRIGFGTKESLEPALYYFRSHEFANA